MIGTVLGVEVGTAVGAAVGAAVGEAVGEAVGVVIAVGKEVGSSLQKKWSWLLVVPLLFLSTLAPAAPVLLLSCFLSS